MERAISWAPITLIYNIISNYSKIFILLRYNTSSIYEHNIIFLLLRNTITEQEPALERWREYNAQLFAKPLTEPTLAIQDYNVAEPVPLYREVSSAILHLKRRKTPGVDGIPADLIRASGLNAVEALYRLTGNIWHDCSWPLIWKIQEIVLLHKGGSPKDCSNYRTIVLISQGSKILLIILLNRLRKKFENELPDEQAGFRRGRGTADMLCCIQNVIEKTLIMSERTFIVFIDYSKAFDSVSHIQMFDILNDMGFPRHIVALIQALYEKQSAIRRTCDSDALYLHSYYVLTRSK